MNKRNIYLLITAIIWGFNYIPQSLAMNHLSPILFCFFRFLLAAITMGLVCLVGKHFTKNKQTIKISIICGACLFIASLLQQTGLTKVSAGKAGFITCIYIVIVPLLSALFYSEKPTLKIWLCCLIALYGLYLLTVKTSLGFELADLYLIGGAILYSIHIILIDKYAGDMDVYEFNYIQYLTVASLSLIIIIFKQEEINISSLINCLPYIAFSGIFSTCISFTTQTLGQIDNDPSIASLIMALESPLALLFGYLLLNEVLTVNEIIGCVIIGIAVVITILPERKKN